MGILCDTKLQKTDVKNGIQVLSSAVKFQLKFCTIFVNKLKTKLIKFGDRNLRNLPHALYVHLHSKRPNHDEDFFHILCASQKV